MNSLQLIPLKEPATAEVHLPGSLSYTIRAMALAAMTKGPVTIHNPLKSDDTYAMLAALQTLGIKNEEEENAFIIHGDIVDVKDIDYTINIRLSGRAARTLLALLCIVPGVKTLTCEEPFKKRPMQDLVEGLRQLGAQIEYVEEEGHLPIKIVSSKLNPGHVQMQGNMSSQYFSAIMMIAPYVGDITIEVLGEQASKPFIDITIEAMQKFGVNVFNKNYKSYIIPSGQNFACTDYYVEADATAASYFWGIAAVSGSKITVKNVSTESKQGDAQFVEILEKMGCTVTADETSITVQGNQTLRAVSVDMNHLPDVVPTLAVIAAFAKGKTVITGLDHLKGKESDRIEAPKQELTKMAITVDATENSLTIEGGSPKGATIETHGDHRIAMAFAVAGAKIPDVIITNPTVVSKSFPQFWSTIEELGIKTKDF
jgi:3-phosphoshikimate 1-carboxyvinyltransferase